MLYAIKPVTWTLYDAQKNHWRADTVVGVLWAWHQADADRFFWELDCENQELAGGGSCDSIDDGKAAAEARYREVLEMALERKP